MRTIMLAAALAVGLAAAGPTTAADPPTKEMKELKDPKGTTPPDNGGSGDAAGTKELKERKDGAPADNGGSGGTKTQEQQKTPTKSQEPPRQTIQITGSGPPPTPPNLGQPLTGGPTITANPGASFTAGGPVKAIEPPKTCDPKAKQIKSPKGTTQTDACPG